MGAKKLSHTHMSTMCGLKKLASGFFSGKFKSVGSRDGSGGGGDRGNGPKTISPHGCPY